MRYWRARNRRFRQKAPPLQVIYIDIEGNRKIRNLREGEDVSKMIVGGNHCISPGDLQIMSRMKLNDLTKALWKHDPSYFWRKPRKRI